MVLPFGAGVGDFFSVLELIHDVSQALRKSGGARSDFQRLLDTFDHIETALIAVNRLTAPDGFEDQLAAIKTAAAQCGHVILAFLHRNESFRTAFSDQASTNRWREPLKKMQWRLYKKEDVDETRLALQEHKSTISMLMSAFHITMTRQNDVVWSQRTTDMTRRFDANDSQQRTLSALLHTSRTDNERQLGQILELLNNMLQYNETHTAVPPQILMSKPVVLIDAKGDSMPFFLECIQTKEAFLFVLKQRFGVGGARRIDDGDYVLEDVARKRDIDQAATWAAWFQPDQVVNMGMIIAEPLRPSDNSCPSCFRLSGAAKDEEIYCPCGLSYRCFCPEFSRDRRRGLEEETKQVKVPEAEDEVCDYKRVRLRPQKKPAPTGSNVATPPSPPMSKSQIFAELTAFPDADPYLPYPSRPWNDPFMLSRGNLPDHDRSWLLDI